MSISNGLTIPNNIANGATTDAPTAMANWNALLVALNRALLDAGSGAGMNAFGSQIHNLGAGSVASDAANVGQLSGYLPLTGGTLTGLLAATAGLTAATQAVNDNTTAAATTAFVQAQLAALLAGNPAFSGAPTAPTAAPGTNTTQIATTAFVLANGTSLGTAYSAPARALGTPYTNGSKYRIVCVNFSAAPSVGLTTFTVVVGGVTVGVPSVSASGPLYTGLITFLVPPGAVYSVTAGGNNVGSAAVSTWTEM